MDQITDPSKLSFQRIGSVIALIIFAAIYLLAAVSAINFFRITEQGLGINYIRSGDSEGFGLALANGIQQLTDLIIPAIFTFFVSIILLVSSSTKKQSVVFYSVTIIMLLVNFFTLYLAYHSVFKARPGSIIYIINLLPALLIILKLIKDIKASKAKPVTI